MKKINIYITCLLLIISSSLNAAIQLTWWANSGETKQINSIEGIYTIDWGDGNISSEPSHTYTEGGEYTVLIEGSVNSLNINGESNPTGVTSISFTEEDNTLTALFMWTNSLLESVDLSNAKALQNLNATLCIFETLDISENINLTNIDLKLSSIVYLVVASSYPYLNVVDVNNSSIEACSLNNLYYALSENGGTIYSVGCEGDATSDSMIATEKGWTFGNGGTGDGSADCEVIPELEAPANVIATHIEGTNNYTITWDEVEIAETYSVKIRHNGDTACDAEYFFTTSNSITINDIEDAANTYYTVYAIRDLEFLGSDKFNFNNELSIKRNISSTEKIYFYNGKITVEGAVAGSKVQLYTLSGMLISTKTVSQSGNVEFNVDNTGIYIVKTAQQAIKIINSSN